MHPTHNIKARAREMYEQEFVFGDGYMPDHDKVRNFIDTIIDLTTQAEREKVVKEIDVIYRNWLRRPKWEETMFEHILSKYINL
jgi:hypothetical protein